MKDQDVTKDTFENAAAGVAFERDKRDRIIANHSKFGLIDLSACEEIEFQIDSDGKKVWVNIDGKCAVRIQQCEHIKITDDRMHDRQASY